MLRTVDEIGLGSNISTEYAPHYIAKGVYLYAQLNSLAWTSYKFTSQIASFIVHFVMKTVVSSRLVENIEKHCWLNVVNLNKEINKFVAVLYRWCAFIMRLYC